MGISKVSTVRPFVPASVKAPFRLRPSSATHEARPPQQENFAPIARRSPIRPEREGRRRDAVNVDHRPDEPRLFEQRRQCGRLDSG